MNTEIIDELKNADRALESDGYKDWCYVRLAISKAIKELQKPHNPVREDVEKLAEALQEIINPIEKMRKDLKEDERLEGMYAVQLSNDANYLKSIAKKALAGYNAGTK